MSLNWLFLRSKRRRLRRRRRRLLHRYYYYYKFTMTGSNCSHQCRCSSRPLRRCQKITFFGKEASKHLIRNNPPSVYQALLIVLSIRIFLYCCRSYWKITSCVVAFVKRLLRLRQSSRVEWTVLLCRLFTYNYLPPSLSPSLSSFHNMFVYMRANPPQQQQQLSLDRTLVQCCCSYNMASVNTSCALVARLCAIVREAVRVWVVLASSSRRRRRVGPVSEHIRKSDYASVVEKWICSLNYLAREQCDQ